VRRLCGVGMIPGAGGHGGGDRDRERDRDRAGGDRAGGGVPSAGSGAFASQRTADEFRIIKEMTEEEVGRFVAENRIDGPAARELLAEPLEVQLAVLDRGPLSVCVNPSAALVGRIRDAKRCIAFAGGGGGDRGGGPDRGVGHDRMFGVGGGEHGGAGPSSSLAAALALPGGSVGSTVAGGSAGGADSEEVDKFIAENRLDQGAAMSLRAEPMHVQQAVLVQGPLFNCTNPSAALMGRIRGARIGVKTHIGGGSSGFGGRDRDGGRDGGDRHDRHGLGFVSNGAGSQLGLHGGAQASFHSAEAEAKKQELLANLQAFDEAQERGAQQQQQQSVVGELAPPPPPRSRRPSSRCRPPATRATEGATVAPRSSTTPPRRAASEAARAAEAAAAAEAEEASRA